jgi:hypothetical protein
MRRALGAAIALVAACGPSAPETCTQDSQCGGNVCARDGECLPADQVWQVKLSWTIGGAPASPTTCASSPDFYIDFYDADPRDSFGFEPVPCQQGQFTVDKLPIRFDAAELGVTGGVSKTAIIQPNGTATFDLAP